MNFKYLAAAGAASLLMAGAAFAQGAGQPTPPNTTGSGSAETGSTVNPSPSTGVTADQSATSSTSTSSGVTTSSTTTSANVAGQNASVTTQTVSMAPVPDTPANRAKYGGPMSRAGKHTKPAGN